MLNLDKHGAGRTHQATQYYRLACLSGTRAWYGIWQCIQRITHMQEDNGHAKHGSVCRAGWARGDRARRRPHVMRRGV